MEEDDPYRRTNLHRTEAPWPAGRPAFCHQAELPWYDPLAFLHEWPERSLPLLIHRATIHGDLNARNVLIEIDEDGRKTPWFIDFSHTGNGLAHRARGVAPRQQATPPTTTSTAIRSTTSAAWRLTSNSCQPI